MPKLLLLLFLILLFFLPLARPFTVIMSDSGVPSTLIDGPQTGFSMNKDGARTDPIEQEAVYNIMKATGNDWATDIPDVCRGRWHGIECMPDKNNVYHIVSLSFGALSDDTAFPTCDPTRSYISPSIIKLPHIKTLFFYRCFINNPQPIPSILGQLGPSLQTLVLRENGYIGQIPTELGNLTSLKVLDLHKNNLNGSIPFSFTQIKGLRSLDLSSNRLTGKIPTLPFPNLSIIDLSQNLLTGSIPSSIGTCKSLLKIDFSHNGLTGQISNSIKSLKDLMLMDLSYNRLLGPFPIYIKSLISLQVLILKGNPMNSETIPSDGFDGMKELIILILSNMNLEGPLPASIAQLPKLRVLHLDGNHFNGSIPTHFKELRNLSELRLNDNWLSGSVPFEREMVWRMKRKLRMYNNSGLCYTTSSGLEDNLDSSFNSGIGLCQTQRPNSVRTVEHLISSIEKDNRPKTLGSISSSSVLREISVSVVFVLIFTYCILIFR